MIQTSELAGGRNTVGYSIFREAGMKCVDCVWLLMRSVPFSECCGYTEFLRGRASFRLSAGYFDPAWFVRFLSISWCCAGHQVVND